MGMVKTSGTMMISAKMITSVWGVFFRIGWL